MRATDLCFLTEVWQEAENRKHQEAIEELLEIHGVKYVSTPRPGARRGGGTAVACSEEFFPHDKVKHFSSQTTGSLLYHCQTKKHNRKNNYFNLLFILLTAEVHGQEQTGGVLGGHGG